MNREAKMRGRSRPSGRAGARGVFLLLLLVGLAAPAMGADVWQWRGDGRDGSYGETGLLRSWPPAGPPMLWSSEEAGAGYSSPVVVKGRVYVTGCDDDHEFLTAFDLAGKKLWRRDYSKAWTDSYPSARSTPTVVDGKAYMVSAAGTVAAVEVASGKLLWSRPIWEETGAEYGRWGVSEAPLVFDGMVICCPGGPSTSVMALDATSGKTVWKSPSLGDGAAYVSPALVEWKGRKQIVAVLERYIFGVDPTTGAIPWKVDYLAIRHENGGNPRRFTINCNTPLFRDGRLFVTSGYDHGCLQLAMADDLQSVSIAWKNDDLDVHHGHVVLVGDHLYGANWVNNSDGRWLCMEWKTGKKVYEAEWHCKGAIIVADGMLYCYEERRGNLALVPATPKGFVPVSSFRIRLGSDKHWAHPVISDGRLYHRHGEALMVFDLRRPEAAGPR